jgi:hypothetical protein
MQEMESGRVSEMVARQLNEVEQKRIDLVNGHVGRLRSGPGAQRFQFLDEYLWVSWSGDSQRS